MALRKAILIQDLSEYLSIIEMPLRAILEKYQGPTVTYRDVVQWIITEDIENYHHLFTTEHRHNQMPYVSFREQLQKTLTMDYDLLIAFYIKAPVLYDTDTVVRLKFTDRDLFMYYDSSTPFNFS
jgi:hypothetical protein